MATQDQTTATTATVRFRTIENDLVAAYAQARQTPELSQAWKNALDRAWEHLKTQGVIEYDPETWELMYHSESGATYRANGTCQCLAFQDQRPCKHRAAARIVQHAVTAYVDREVAKAVENLELERLQAKAEYTEFYAAA